LIEPCLTPIYPLTEGVSQSLLRKALKQILPFCEGSNLLLQEWLPVVVRKNFMLPTLAASLKTLHAPNPAVASVSMRTRVLPEFRRLAAEELLAHHFARIQARNKARLATAPVFSDHTEMSMAFTQALGFSLTSAQQRVIKEITDDCMNESPMMRLIQGDVGCGKTIVSAFAALGAVYSGYQVGIMAPTELLAEQHFSNFKQWFEPYDIQVDFLSGKIKGQRRIANLTAIKGGDSQIIIGTHALFQTSVEFNRLGLVIIDEQHRFGVNQRLVLKNKGQVGDLKPHQLMMSATPIPRTLAMLRYSDLDISVIDELPPGRKAVITRALPAQKRAQIIARIMDWVSHRKQAYWVCTLIEESDILQCEAAEKTLATLITLLPDIKIGLVHGRLKTADKIQVMADFKQHKIDLLVATTVIEVGVDVPNAGLMVIENSERLGLSQLHQLRGRVGRGKDESFCLLMYQSPLSRVARERLTILRETNDGFLLAEKDLELRGAGDVLGTRQTGEMAFKVADLSLHQDLIDQVPAMAEMINKEAPEVIQPIIDRWFSALVHYVEV
jgi:ATP-dependent DNA helicase RecG